MPTAPQNNMLYLIIGVLAVLAALFAYWSYTGSGPLRGSSQPEGVNLQINENGISGTIRAN